MTKQLMPILALATAMLAPASLGAAQFLGPTPALCSEGSAPSILVRVSGLKDRHGKVRVRTFGGSPENYFDKTKALLRVEYALPNAGSVDVCVPVPAVGVYAVDVRHDVNGNGKTDRADGAGASGNPKLTLFDVLFKRRPPARQVQVSVGQGTTIVPIQVRYL
jgi:uncharacterized protein (DUF2141 family)